MNAAFSCKSFFACRHFKTVNALRSSESKAKVFVNTTTNMETVKVPQTAMNTTKNLPNIVLGKKSPIIT